MDQHLMIAGARFSTTSNEMPTCRRILVTPAGCLGSTASNDRRCQ